MNTNSLTTSILLSKALQDSTFLNAFGSAIGGFVGVFIFFLIRWLLALYISRKKKVQSYTVANHANKLPASEQTVHGAIIPSCGSASTPPRDLASSMADKQVWKYTAKHESQNGESDRSGNIFYGPYSSLPRPGHYKATFRICAEGLPDGKDEHDYLLLELDVAQGLQSLIQRNNGPCHVSNVQTIARHFVRISDLRPKARSTNKWVEIDIIFYSDAKGLWEFRAYAYNGKDNRPNFIKKCGDAFAIYFDSVDVYLVPDIEIPAP